MSQLTARTGLPVGVCRRKIRGISASVTQFRPRTSQGPGSTEGEIVESSGVESGVDFAREVLGRIEIVAELRAQEVDARFEGLAILVVVAGEIEPARLHWAVESSLAGEPPSRPCAVPR